MPEKLNDFSDFQLKNFLDRSLVTQKIEDVRKDMNRDGLGILGLANIDGAIMRKIASEDSSYMVYVKRLPKSKREDMEAFDVKDFSQDSQFSGSDSIPSSSKSGLPVSLVEKALEKEFHSRVITGTDETPQLSQFSKSQSRKTEETTDLNSDQMNCEKATGFNLQEVLSRLKKPIEVKSNSVDKPNLNISVTTTSDCKQTSNCSANISIENTISDKIELLENSDDDDDPCTVVASEPDLVEIESSPKGAIKFNNPKQDTDEIFAETCDSGVSSQCDSLQQSQELTVVSTERNSVELQTSRNPDDAAFSSSDEEFEDVELNVTALGDVKEFEKTKEIEPEMTGTSNCRNSLSTIELSEPSFEAPNEQRPSTSIISPDTRSMTFDTGISIPDGAGSDIDHHAISANLPVEKHSHPEAIVTKNVKHWNSDENASNLELEEQQLIRELEKEETRATTVTEIMYDQCQKLLRLFGLPYIVSPGEAEAQCAFLDYVGLVNGSITDDSDVWLFGGKTVYKNFFEREKFVEKFTMAEIEGKLMVNRSNLICLAMMLGSDYCDGIENIGPVHGMEVLEEFGREFGVEV